MIQLSRYIYNNIDILPIPTQLPVKENDLANTNTQTEIVQNQYSYNVIP